MKYKVSLKYIKKVIQFYSNFHTLEYSLANSNSPLSRYILQTSLKCKDGTEISVKQAQKWMGKKSDERFIWYSLHVHQKGCQHAVAVSMIAVPI